MQSNGILPVRVCIKKDENDEVNKSNQRQVENMIDSHANIKRETNEGAI